MFLGPKKYLGNQKRLFSRSTCATLRMRNEMHTLTIYGQLQQMSILPTRCILLPHYHLHPPSEGYGLVHGAQHPF